MMLIPPPPQPPPHAFLSCSWARVTPLVASPAPSLTLLRAAKRPHDFASEQRRPTVPPHIPPARAHACAGACGRVRSPMTEMSYSIRNKASWLLCISMVNASACFSRFKGMPSRLRILSPALTVPSLEKDKRGENMSAKVLRPHFFHEGKSVTSSSPEEERRKGTARRVCCVHAGLSKDSCTKRSKGTVVSPPPFPASHQTA